LSWTTASFNKTGKRWLALILIVCCFNSFAVAEKQYFSWDFSDCEIKDILFAISLDTGISIVPDDTVSGKGSLKFAGKDFTTAFDAFLSGCRLCVQKGEKLWTVSKFASHKENGLYYVEAYDLTPVQLVEKLSVMVDKVITFDALPGQRISVNFKGINETALMESLCKRFGNYEFIQNDVGYHFFKKTENKRVEAGDINCRVEKNGVDFYLDVKNCYFVEVVEKLFNLEKSSGSEKNYCLLSNGEIKVSRTVFSSGDFNSALEQLCWQNGFSFLQDKGIYYIFLDSSSKSDLMVSKKNWEKYDLDYVNPQDFFSILYKRIGKVEIVETGNSSFISCVTEEQNTIIKELIEEIDVEKNTYLITLKYIKPEDLLKHLPPSIDKNAITIADELQCVYFKGTEKAYKNFVKELALCDRPLQRITYDLLILQYDETQQNTWSSNFDCKRLSANSRNNVSAVLGSVMGLNMNVISAFGLNFAVELQSSIENNKTKVFADTTLHGISGKQINFQNTNTYRYRDNNVNPETGAPIYSGITREISSGIKLEVLGWVSGEGMITSKVTASISRQGTDSSASTGNPPPTSEKIVTTEVYGKSGEPVVLSGLVITADFNQEKRTPVISKIPLLGALFKNINSTKEKSQMVIYLVPHLESLEEKYEKKIFDKKWADKWLTNVEILENEEEEIING